MSLPKRWLDGGDDLTPGERRTLEADLDHGAPLHAKRAVRTALLLKLTAASAAAAAPVAVRSSAQKGVAAKLVSLTLLKSVGVGFALSAVVGVGFSLSEQHRAAQGADGGTVRRATPVPSRHAPPAPDRRGAESPIEPRSLPSSDAPSGHALRNSVARDSTGEHASLSATASASESQRVAEARALLRAGRASDALATLQALEHDEPSGLLVQERESLAIQALAQLGEREAARKRAAAFAVQYPASPHLSAVRRAAE
jgi:hypothetical protein